MTMSNETLQGRKPIPSGRRPRTYAEDRVCQEEGCQTRLSRYNRSRLCYPHTPKRYPRTRGRVSS